MKKRFYSILFITFLVFTMVFSNFIVYAASPSSWAQAEVNEARNKSLVLPEADDNFQNEITRELFCKLVVNLVEQATDDPVSVTIANPFQDTNNSDIVKAYQLGIVNGMSATEFGPELLITREQVAAMMMRSARKLDELMNHNFTMIQMEGEADFADLDNISSWALQDIRAANSLGIMKGVGNNKIDPKGNTTIEQSLLLILRVFNEYLPLKDNNAPALLPTGTFEFDVSEGTSITIQLSDIAYDEDGDFLRIIGYGGNTSAGNMISSSTDVTFTAEMVDEDTDSVWDVSVTDEVEQTEIELIFHVKDTLNEPPVGLQKLPFIVDEGETIVFTTAQVAQDADGDVLFFTDFEVSSDMTSEIGEGIIIASVMRGTPNSFSFTADLVSQDTYTVYDMTITDGTNEIMLPIRINVNDVNNPPVGNPITTLHQNEGTGKIYFGLNVATDTDEDTLEVIDFAVSSLNQHDIGTPEIRDFDGARYFYFTADNVVTATWTYYDLTVTDGIHEVIVTIRIQVDNLN
jgi:hypothetical protein